MKYRVQTFVNKVRDDETSPFGTRVLRGEYDMTHEFIHESDSLPLHNRGFVSFDGETITYDLGKWFQIHSYQTITLLGA